MSLSRPNNDTNLTGRPDGWYIVNHEGIKKVACISSGKIKGRKISYSQYVPNDILANNSIDLTTS